MATKKKFKSYFFPKEPRKENQFDVSFGNIQVLRLIPDMMNDKEFRNKLRMLAFEFIQEYGIR